MKGREGGGEHAWRRLGRSCEMPLEPVVGDTQKGRCWRLGDGNQGLDAPLQALKGGEIASSCTGMVGSEGVLVMHRGVPSSNLSVQPLAAETEPWAHL